MRKVYLEYKDEDEFGNEKLVKGIFELVKETDSLIKIKSNNNLITLSSEKIQKMKEKL